MSGRAPVTQTYNEMMSAHRERRREQLLIAAAAELNERGIRQVTMNQVAQRAGVSKVILYRYFKSKDNLVHAVLEAIVDALLTADMIETDWWTGRLRHTLKVAREHGSAMQLLVRHASHDPEFGVHFDRLSHALAMRIEQRQADILGPVSEGPGDIHILSQTITAFLLDAYVRWIDATRPERDEEFLMWITRSVRAMIYYWRGLEP